MRKTIVRAVLAAVFVVPVMVAPAFANDMAHGKQEKGHAAHWSYEGETGPEHWGDLKPEYGLCKEGKSQSPIDIDQTVETALDPIKVSYKASPIDIVNNGHTVQVNYAPGSTITVGGKTFDLLQFHFHSPGEHTVHGKPADFVAHLVHKTKEGELGVIEVRMNRGAENPFLNEVWPHIPGKEGESRMVMDAMINVAELLPSDMSYYGYSGSLTTPPCSEGVNWMVLKHPVSISDEQVQKFTRLFANSVRPVQPLNGRAVRND